MVKKKLVFLVMTFLLLGFLSGCEMDWGRLTKPIHEDKNQLIRVEIHFTDDETLIGYVKTLGIEPEGRIYVGGSSSNYLYDARGRIVGAFNYQRVLYMKILPAET